MKVKYKMIFSFLICFSYDERMESALTALEQGKSYSVAAKQFSVCRSTLWRYHQKGSKQKLKIGGQTSLSPDEEKRIKGWIVGCAARGFPLRSREIINEASAVLRERTGQAMKLLSMFFPKMIHFNDQF